MPPFEPSDPVTLGYVGLSCGVAGIALRILKEALPKRRRPAAVPWILLLIALCGINALIVWIRALVGWLPQSGSLMPANTDALTFVSGVAGLVTLLAVIAALWLRFARKNKEIDLERFVTIWAGVGLGVGFLLWFGLPGLDFT